MNFAGGRLFINSPQRAQRVKWKAEYWIFDARCWAGDGPSAMLHFDYAHGKQGRHGRDDSGPEKRPCGETGPFGKNGTVTLDLFKRGCQHTKSKLHSHHKAIMLCLDGQVVCLPGIEATFELHNGKARLGEAFCGFGGKMAHLRVAVHDVYSVFVQT